jgi:hypothetical protein
MFLVETGIIRITSDLVVVRDMEDIDVDQIEGSPGAADDTEGVRQRLLSESRAAKRRYDRAENGIAYFLSRGRVMVQREMEKPGSPTPGNTPASSSTVRNTLNSLSRFT